MIGKCAGARQLDFVTPPRPTQAGTDGQTITHLAAVPAYPCASIIPNPTKSANSIPHPPTPPCDSIVSYGAATPMRRMRRLSDTNKIVTDTKSVARPYLAPRHCPPKTPAPRPDEIRQLYPAPQIPVVHHPFDTCVSYGPATTTLQIRHLSDTNNFSPDTKSVEMSNGPLSGPTTPPAQDSLSTPRRNPPTLSRPPIPRHPTLMLHMCQLWPSYDHATNATLFRYESPFFRYEKCSMSIASPYLDRRHRPPSILRSHHDEIRQPHHSSPRGTTWSNTSQLRQWNEWNASQIQITRPQLRTEFHSLSGAGPFLTPNIPLRPTTKSNNFQSPPIIKRP